jgi:hypothetical protein
VPHGQAAGALMGGLETRIGRLEVVARQTRRPGISGERRKALTDRAVLHGDLEALQEHSLHRFDKISASAVQRSAAIAAGRRADL